ncbi:MAG: helicase-related protein, partial [Urechidicola sp.]|nr:helicase-related protein [Urechidicola sp.]
NLFDYLWLDKSPLTDRDRIQIDIWEKNKQNEEVKNLLGERIGPLFYRVRKKDLGLIPAVFHKPIIVKMNKYEKKIYSLIKSKIYELSNEDYFENQELLVKLWRGRMIRLRQVSSYPKLLLSAINNYKEDLLGSSELKQIIENYDSLEITGKLEELTRIVLRLREDDKKVLIWSNFIGSLELIKRHFSNMNYRCELIYGKTPSRNKSNENISDILTREDIRDIFVDENSGLDILIANPAACAESISLHKTCYHAIYYDLSYNCAQYLQSLDRIHRVGGSEEKQANYYFLQYENSIDIDIKSNLEQKAEKMYSIIEEDYEIYNLDMFESSDDDDVQAYKRIFKK